MRKNLTQTGEPQRYSWGTQEKKKKKNVYDSPKLVNPRDILGNAEEEEGEEEEEVV